MSVVEEVRKVLQDSLAPELRSIGTRLEPLEKQRVEDRTDILRAVAPDKADVLRAAASDKADILRGIADGNAHMEKRFELVIDYTKVLQRVDKLEEARQAESH